ncbi:MAG: peroxide stress protein YaaA [Atopobiaceae bacterium]|nr:peroxide stress protein YaaA [Atopobiaceae bacterium]
MRIIVSPAKKMTNDPDAPRPLGLPTFVREAERLRDWVRSLSYAEQKALWRCSDAIARRSAEQFAHMDLRESLTPALLSYDGIQYTYMAPTVFDNDQLGYVQEHLRILSGFYGALRPMDGVTPYRLEMQAKVAVDGHANLYEYWGDLLYRNVMGRDRVLVNLASKEYSKAVERYLQPEDRYVTCVFGELVGGRVVQRGVYAKMARGEMVRYLASIRAEEPEQMRTFAWSGYTYDENRSTNATYVFVR